MFHRLVLAGALVAGGALAAETGAEYGPSDFRREALSGDLSRAREKLAASGDPAAAALLERFTARFVDRTDTGPTPDDPEVARLVALYRAYWADALLAPARLDEHEQALAAGVSAIVGGNPEEAIGLVPAFLETRGYQAIAGRTPPLLELMLWERTVTEPTKVTLTDGVVEVPVHSLEGFVSYGWSHHATLGAAQTGGWATTDGLYLVEESYDLHSETYRVSFLTHESRHYADYQLFPALGSADLEYRAKLTELVYARETLADLLDRFTRSAAPAANAPHALAAWHLVGDLSERLLGRPRPDSAEDWGAVRPREVRRAARALLRAHTAALVEAGAEATTGVLGQRQTQGL